MKTKYGTPFLIHDNKKRNRILVFAAKIAFETVFDVKVIGCLFHFGQSLFKKYIIDQFMLLKVSFKSELFERDSGPNESDSMKVLLADIQI